MPPSLADAARTAGRAIRGCGTARRWRRELRRRSPRRQRRATRARSRDARRWRRLGHDDRRARVPSPRRVPRRRRPRDPPPSARPRRGASSRGRRDDAVPLAARAAAIAIRRRRRATLAGGGALNKTALVKLKVAELRAELERRGASAEGRPRARGSPSRPRPSCGTSSRRCSRAGRRRASPAPEKPRRDARADPVQLSPRQRAVRMSTSSARTPTGRSGMELTFQLGTSSGSPSFTRNVSSYALRCG